MEWIKIEDGLPPVGVPLIVTINDSFRGCRAIRYPVIYRYGLYENGLGWYVNGNEEEILLPEYSKIVAWMKMPKPY